MSPQTQQNPQATKPRLCLTIGVTGHRLHRMADVDPGVLAVIGALGYRPALEPDAAKAKI